MRHYTRPVPTEKRGAAQPPILARAGMIDHSIAAFRQCARIVLSDRLKTRSESASSELSLGWWMLVSTAVVSVRKRWPLAMQSALARATTCA